MAAARRHVPQRAEHLERAFKNEKLAEHFAKASDPTCIDWAITLLFYSALHLVDGFVAGKNVHPLDHYERNEQIENNGSLTPIHQDFRRLQQMSENARYEIAKYEKRNYDQAWERYVRIRNHIMAKMFL